MSLLPIFVEYRDTIDDKLYSVAVVCFDPPNELAIILHKKKFIKVPLIEIQFSRWNG